MRSTPRCAVPTRRGIVLALRLARIRCSASLAPPPLQLHWSGLRLSYRRGNHRPRRRDGVCRVSGRCAAVRTKPIQMNDGGDQAERIAGALTGGDQAMMLTTVPAHPQRPPLPDDPAQPPAPGWMWCGKDPPGGIKGAWYNPSTKESLHPDLHTRRRLDRVGITWMHQEPDGASSLMGAWSLKSEAGDDHDDHPSPARRCSA